MLLELGLAGVIVFSKLILKIDKLIANIFLFPLRRQSTELNSATQRDSMS